jgi:hypothetical protein
VANTFGGATGKPSAVASKPHAASPATPTVTQEVTTQIAGNQTAPPQPKPTGLETTMPHRAEAVARAETAWQEMPTPHQRAYLAKAPSQAHPNVPTGAAAPPAATEGETLAPLIDAETYRAKFANARSTQPVQVRTAARDSAQPVSGSWVAAYERLVQRNGSNPSPRPPAGSPTRRLSSDDEPAIPKPETPILRR